MKAYYSLALTVVLVLLLSVLLAAARPIREGQSSSMSSNGSSSSSSSEAAGVFQADKTNPAAKQIDSSFRRIPPSTSNPIQNKSNPPLQGQRSRRRQQLPRSLKH